MKIVMIKCRDAAGYTLIELMASLLLATLVVAGLWRAYRELNHHDRAMNQSLQREAQLRLSLSLLQRVVARAGFLGCVRLANLEFVNHTPYTVTAATWLVRFRHDGIEWHPALPSSLAGKVSSDSDVVQVQAVAPGLSELSVVEEDGHTLIVPAPPALWMKPGALLLVTDCLHAELVTLDAVKGTAWTTRLSSRTPLSYHYQRPAIIGQWQQQRYFIRRLPGGKQVLEVQHTDGRVDAVVAGLKQLRVTGIDRQHRVVPLPQAAAAELEVAAESSRARGSGSHPTAVPVPGDLGKAGKRAVMIALLNRP